MPNTSSRHGQTHQRKGISTPSLDLSAPFIPTPPESKLPVSMVEAFLATLPIDIAARFAHNEDLSGLATAQFAWMMREKTLDPRVRLYSDRATPDDLWRAMCVLRGLFDHLRVPELTLASALDWLCIIHRVAEDAQERHQPSLLPLPYKWIPKADIDEYEAQNPFDWLNIPPAPQRIGRKRRKPMAAETTAQAVETETVESVPVDSVMKTESAQKREEIGEERQFSIWEPRIPKRRGRKPRNPL